MLDAATTTTTTTDLLQTAYHAAGHAIVADFFGFCPDEVVLDPSVDAAEGAPSCAIFTKSGLNELSNIKGRSWALRLERVTLAYRVAVISAAGPQAHRQPILMGGAKIACPAVDCPDALLMVKSLRRIYPETFRRFLAGLSVEAVAGLLCRWLAEPIELLARALIEASPNPVTSDHIQSITRQCIGDNNDPVRAQWLAAIETVALTGEGYESVPGEMRSLAEAAGVPYRNR